jgi:hypothetical protein
MLTLTNILQQQIISGHNVLTIHGFMIQNRAIVQLLL